MPRAPLSSGRPVIERAAPDADDGWPPAAPYAAAGLKQPLGSAKRRDSGAARSGEPVIAGSARQSEPERPRPSADGLMPKPRGRFVWRRSRAQRPIGEIHASLGAGPGPLIGCDSQALPRSRASASSVRDGTGDRLDLHRAPLCSVTRIIAEMPPRPPVQLFGAIQRLALDRRSPRSAPASLCATIRLLRSSTPPCRRGRHRRTAGCRCPCSRHGCPAAAPGRARPELVQASPPRRARPGLTLSTMPVGARDTLQDHFGSDRPRAPGINAAGRPVMLAAALVGRSAGTPLLARMRSLGPRSRSLATRVHRA